MAPIEAAADKVLVLVEHARRVGCPVVFIRTIHSDWTNSENWLRRPSQRAGRDGVCEVDSWGSEFYRVQPQPSEPIVVKHRYSGFAGTELDSILRARRITTLLVVGFATYGCVEATCRDAYERDYGLVLVEDCCGAVSEAAQAETIRNIAEHFGIVATSSEILQVWHPR